MTKTEEKIYQAIGEASMCWSETPKGVYDDVKAKAIGDELWNNIQNELALAYETGYKECERDTHP